MQRQKLKLQQLDKKRSELDAIAAKKFVYFEGGRKAHQQRHLQLNKAVESFNGNVVYINDLVTGQQSAIQGLESSMKDLSSSKLGNQQRLATEGQRQGRQ